MYIFVFLVLKFIAKKFDYFSECCHLLETIIYSFCFLQNGDMMTFSENNYFDSYYNIGGFAEEMLLTKYHDKKNFSYEYNSLENRISISEGDFNIDYSLSDKLSKDKREKFLKNSQEILKIYLAYNAQIENKIESFGDKKNLQDYLDDKDQTEAMLKDEEKRKSSGEFLNFKSQSKNYLKQKAKYIHSEMESHIKDISSNLEDLNMKGAYFNKIRVYFENNGEKKLALNSNSIYLSIKKSFDTSLKYINDVKEMENFLKDEYFNEYHDFL